MQILIENALILPEKEPAMVNGAPVHFARVQYLGGEMRCANPNKFSGMATEVRLDVSLRTSAQVFTRKATGATGAFVGLTVTAERIASATLAKK